MRRCDLARLSRTFVTRLTVLMSSVALLSCSPPHEPVNLAGNSWLGFQPFYVAIELTPHRAQNSELSFHVLPSSSNVMRLMAERQLDGGFLTVDEALVYQQNTEEPLCVAMVTNVSNGGDAIVMQADWREREEPLEIAREPTAVGGYMLQRAQQLNAFEGKLISPSIATLNRQADLFLSDSIDGVVTFHPILAQLSQHGEIIFDSSMIAGEIVDLLVIKRSVWRQHQQHIDPNLRRLWQTSLSDLRSLSPRVIDIISNNTGLSHPQIRTALGGLELIGATTSAEFNLAGAVDHVQKFLLAAGDLTRRQSLDYCRQPSESP